MTADATADKSALARLDSLIDLAQVLGQQSDYEDVLRLVVEKASSVTPADEALVMMLNPKTRDTIKTIYAAKNAGNTHTHFMHTNISGWVILNKAPLLSPDVKRDTRFRKNLFQNVSAKSAMCVPFTAGNAVIGTLLLLTFEDGSVFTEEHLDFVRKLSALSSPFLHSAQTVSQYFAVPLPRKTLLNKFAGLGLYGKSKPFIELLRAIEAASHCDVRVLIEGESGTGKELVARSIHNLSARASGAFVAIDCGAIHPHLVESELFGHVKGAFTGATSTRKGLLEGADLGTLFLDEVNNLPLELQSRLLRVLEDGQVRPVGSNSHRKVDVRIVAASSVSLRTMVNESRFREELYYRLNVFPIAVPALKERAEDIPFLAEHFLKHFASAQKKNIEGFHEEVLDFMKDRVWAGNVRELENFVERIVTLAKVKEKTLAKTILPKDVQTELKKILHTERGSPAGKSLRESLGECEEQLLRRALEDADWNQSKAARMLMISEPSLRYKMKKLSISRVS